MSESNNQRGTCVPVISGEDLQSDCCPPEGGTKTVGAPKYVLVVKNPDAGVAEE